MRKLLIVIAMVIAVMLCACGGPQQQQQTTTAEAAADPIVGTWKVIKYSMWLAPDDVVTLEGSDLTESFGNNYYKFDADGSGTITADKVTQTSWKNTAPDTYILTYTNGETNKETEVMLTISGDSMTGLEGSRDGIGSEYIFEKE